MYITPDNEIKKLLELFEKDPETFNFQVAGVCIYSLYKFHLEMQIRIAYYNTYNAPFNNELSTVTENNPAYEKRSVFFAMRQKLQKRMAFKKQMRDRKIYLQQFDKIANDSVSPVLFVVTSAFMDQQHHSLELNDVVDFFHSINVKIHFVIPDYSSTIRRSKLFARFYNLNFNYPDVFSKQEKEVISRFKDFILFKVPFLFKKAFTELEGFLLTQIHLSAQLKKVIEATDAKYVIGRSLYSDVWVPLACKNSDVKCIEVQHGVFTRDNLYYYSEDQLCLQHLFLPDYIALLGNSWHRLLKSQSPRWTNDNSFVLGIKSKLKSSVVVTKKITTVLIALQDFSTNILDIRPQMLSFFQRYALQLKAFHFVLRYHPANNPEVLNEFLKIPDISISISHPKQKCIAESLNTTDVLISASSMVLYEALTIGKKVISFEKYRKMVIEEGISFVNDEHDLLKILSDKTPAKPIDYFSEFNPTNLFNLVTK